MRQRLGVLAVLLGVTAASGVANAQEIQLTGPLAGAPAVRQLRLHRKGRLEVAPQISFTLLDEYQRTILAGAKINYNITDWFALGVWGAFGAVKSTTGLAENIDTQVNGESGRRKTEPAGSINNALTLASIGPDFQKQLGTIDYMASPQITLVPFRGKLAIFQQIFVDTDAYIFGGPAFVGLTERADCSGSSCGTPTEPGGAVPLPYPTKSRTAVTGSFGLGLSFYIGKWASLGLEWRAIPFAWNTGGFDTRGGPPDGRFPDLKINSDDRELKFNQMLSVSLGIFLPAKLKSSE